VRSLEEAPYLDLFDPEFQADPVSAVALLRQQCPLIRTPIGVLIVDRVHVHDLLRERSLHSSLLQLVRLQGLTEGPVYEMAESSLLAQEGEDHTRIRRLVSRSFTPRAADGHRPFMRTLVTELVDRFAPNGECEFMADFADQYSVQVIAHLLGVPRQDHALFARWGNSLTHLLSLELWNHREEVETAQAAMSSYLADLVADRRRQPRRDLVSELIAARDGQEDGRGGPDGQNLLDEREGDQDQDDGRGAGNARDGRDGRDRLDDRELLSLLGGLLFAGYDTTRNQLAVAMTVFAEHPTEWARLADHPELGPAAVEELMRAAGVVSVVPRVATRQLEVGEWDIPAGTLVSLSLAGANHDPAVYAQANRFDMRASRPDAHIGFGGGAHHCLGANLARAEMQEALPILATTLRDLRVADPPAWRSPLGGIAGPLSLELRFTPRAASGGT
jgi:cytochrome P450